MTPLSDDTLAALVAAYQAGRSLVLLFDFDGTLTPLVAHPRLARLPERMRVVLQDLSRRPRISVGVISGRMLENVKRLVDVPGLYYSGTSGLELDLRGVPFSHPRAEEGYALVAQAVQRLRSIASRYPGAWVEHKRLGLTLHYRDVAELHVRNLCCQARQLFRPWAADWRLVDGAMALEATPALGWTKASAVRMILLEVGGNACPLYAGDDGNDHDAMDAVNALGGVSIGIGLRAPAIARHRLADPAGLLRLLGRLQTGLDATVVDQEPREDLRGQTAFGPS